MVEHAISDSQVSQAPKLGDAGGLSTSTTETMQGVDFGQIRNDMTTDSASPYLSNLQIDFGTAEKTNSTNTTPDGEHPRANQQDNGNNGRQDGAGELPRNSNSEGQPPQQDDGDKLPVNPKPEDGGSKPQQDGGEKLPVNPKPDGGGSKPQPDNGGNKPVRERGEDPRHNPTPNDRAPRPNS